MLLEENVHPKITHVGSIGHLFFFCSHAWHIRETLFRGNHRPLVLKVVISSRGDCIIAPHFWQLSGCLSPHQEVPLGVHLVQIHFICIVVDALIVVVIVIVSFAECLVHQPSNKMRPFELFFNRFCCGGDGRWRFQRIGLRVVRILLIALLLPQ